MHDPIQIAWAISVEGDLCRPPVHRGLATAGHPPAARRPSVLAGDEPAGIWGMPPIKIAPSIRIALRRVTAKDHRSINHEFGKQLMAASMPSILADPSTHLCEGSGKFWDPDSDSEYEDLGDADILAQRAVLPPRAASTEVVVHRQPAIQPSRGNTKTPSRAASPDHRASTSAAPVTSSPRMVLAPWRRLWKGPLPPRRITLPANLSDFIFAGHGRHSPKPSS